MTQEKDASILTHFANLEDPRDNQGKEHLLIDIITIALCTVISGEEGWEDTAEYGHAKQEWLSTFLSLRNGIPCTDIFARVFARIDPTVTAGIRLAAVTWIQSLVRDPNQREILFDLDTVYQSLFETSGQSTTLDLVSKTQANLLRQWMEV